MVPASALLRSRRRACCDHSDVAGEADTEFGETHACLWQNGVAIDLGTLGGAFSGAQGINNRGEVTGWSETATGDIRAFVWRDGVMREVAAP